MDILNKLISRTNTNYYNNEFGRAKEIWERREGVLLNSQKKQRDNNKITEILNAKYPMYKWYKNCWNL